MSSVSGVTRNCLLVIGLTSTDVDTKCEQDRHTQQTSNMWSNKLHSLLEYV